jgi:hypothetical protein
MKNKNYKTYVTIVCDYSEEAISAYISVKRPFARVQEVIATSKRKARKTLRNNGISFMQRSRIHLKEEIINLK